MCLRTVKKPIFILDRTWYKCRSKYTWRQILIKIFIRILIWHDFNEGAIFLPKNQQVSMRTKHIDVRYHFIRDLVQENMLNIVYVRSEENYADIMTKNVSVEIFNRLFVRGVQSGIIETKGENVGRTRSYDG